MLTYSLWHVAYERGLSASANSDFELVLLSDVSECTDGASGEVGSDSVMTWFVGVLSDRLTEVNRKTATENHSERHYRVRAYCDPLKAPDAVL